MIYNTTKFGEGAGTSGGFGKWDYQGRRHGHFDKKRNGTAMFGGKMPGEGQLLLRNCPWWHNWQ